MTDWEEVFEELKTELLNAHGQNGRYKNISHVAIYIGDGKKVHAKGKKYGVVCDAYRPSNIGVYARPQ